MLQIADLTNGAAPADLGLDLDEAGVPRRPVVVIDASGLNRLDSSELATAARLLRAAESVVVFTVGDEPLPTELHSVADIVVADIVVAEIVGSTSAAMANAVVVKDLESTVADLVDKIEASARASVTLSWLLRQSADLPIMAALTAESAAYSMLLAGPDFQSWLAHRGTARPPDGRERIRLSREGDNLTITLARPGRRNAVDAAMRNALLEALQLARHHEALQITIDADGPSFCAGGDLDEFGSATDPVTAHLVRVSASVGASIAEFSSRITARVHGDCVGAGIELPAFAGRIVAAPDSRFRLPEVAMGLIPGAGGTVSICRRIGRWRTAWFALSAATLDAPTALRFGLIDEIS